MYKCEYCDKTYEEPDYIEEPMWDLRRTMILDYEYIPICPYCKSRHDDENIEYGD